MATGHRSIVKDPAKAFISTWRTSTVYTGSTANNQIKLPLMVDGLYKFTVQWGDGTSNLITIWNQAETTHTYPAPGDYTVTITGFIKGWDWGGGGTVAPTTGDMRKLLTITQWGCLRFVNKESLVQIWGPFYGCINLNLTTVQDTPNFKGVTSITGFLRRCLIVTTVNNINKWDVSKITLFRNSFREMPIFDDNIGNWNTSNATNMSAMFSGAVNPAVAPYGSFNNGGSDSIKNWNTSKVTTLNGTFNAQPSFNQPVGDWDISNVTDLGLTFQSNVNATGVFNNGGSDSIKNWNTSKVTIMQQTFTYQHNFNQPIGNWDTSNVTRTDYMFFSNALATIFNQDISKWNTSKITLARAMFANNTAFNQDINTKTVTINGNTYQAWDTSLMTDMREIFSSAVAFNQSINNWNVSNATAINGFMSGKTDLNYSAANYDALLIGWASRPVKPNISITFGTIKYTAAASAARAILTSAPNNWTIVDGGI